MIFDEFWIHKDLDVTLERITYRDAARAIILHENKILLLETNKGDLKIPGGGVNEGEILTDAVIREVREETGYIHCAAISKIGMIIEKYNDLFDHEAIFQMQSHFFLCELAGWKKTNQQLDDYEDEQEFTPKWVTLDEAIEQNRKIISKQEKNDWVVRENFVLEALKNYGISKLYSHV